MKRTVRKLATALGAALCLVVCDAAAHADELSLDTPGMSGAMHEYFAGEKGEGVWFFAAGFTAIAGASFLYTRARGRNDDFARGMMYPVVAIGVLQTIVGLVVYFRTDAQVAKLDRSLASSPAMYRDTELARIRKVNTEFTVLEWTELALTAGGAAVAIFGPTDKQILKGIGAGLAVQGAAMLTLDLLAAGRAHEYTSALEGFRF